MALTNNNNPTSQTRTQTRKSVELYFDSLHGTLQQDGETLNLDPIIARLLEWFMARPNQILSRQELADNVWQSEFVSNDAVNRGISVLRKSLGGERADFITTIPRQGYRFVVPEHVILHRAAHINAKEIGTTGPPNDAQVLTRLGLRLGVLVVVLVLFVWFYVNTAAAPVQIPDPELRQTTSTIKGIAVLPFKVVEGSQTEDAFVDGLRELILNDLTRIKGLLVMAKPDTSAQYYLQGS
ncbi:MAG: winged helix-turn-helix domain-containing protein, partial [Algicola sp.]|nr:winged helix-turn-helix domain-containing protein [Algicola sp.]